MKTILVLDSSVSGEESVTRPLVGEALRGLMAAWPSSRVIHHDLGTDPLPHLTTATLAGLRGEPVTEAERQTRRRSDTLIDELRQADIIVVGAPMVNFGPSTALRSWFDHVLRAGETFSYSAAGPKGLVLGKRVIVIEARGGSYADGPARVFDFQEPYLRQLFGFMGMTDTTFVRAEGLGLGPEARAGAIAAARSEIEHLVQEGWRKTA